MWSLYLYLCLAPSVFLSHLKKEKKKERENYKKRKKVNDVCLASRRKKIINLKKSPRVTLLYKSDLWIRPRIFNKTDIIFKSLHRGFCDFARPPCLGVKVGAAPGAPHPLQPASPQPLPSPRRAGASLAAPPRGWEASPGLPARSNTLTLQKKLLGILMGVRETPGLLGLVSSPTQAFFLPVIVWGRSSEPQASPPPPKSRKAA